MNTYEITFQRENGTTGSDRFTAAAEAQARRDFREVYRHGNGQITKVELISSDSPATKEQERKALEKIKKIVNELGEGSYIGTAFEGCFEIAEENIEYDFCCSMKQRAESAEKKLKTAELDNRDLRNAIKELKSKCLSVESKVLALEDAGKIKAILHHAKMEVARMADSSAQRIVELADSPDSQEFRQAVQDNRQSKKRLVEYEELTQRLLDTMK